MTLIKKGCMIFFHGKHITPAYLDEDKQKMLIDEGLIADKYIVKQGKVKTEEVKTVEYGIDNQYPQTMTEADEKAAIREELKELGIKAGGRTSIEKLREMLKEAKGE